MRLLDLDELKIKDFSIDKRSPSYVILSHTWGEGEVNLQEVLGSTIDDLEKKIGWEKITGFCRTACKRLGSVKIKRYGWVDTCCIDKTSSTELSEAINSMFRWYAKAKECYVYLADVVAQPAADVSSGIHTVGQDFEHSRWFTRGWTLQELLAPTTVLFFDCEWRFLGSKRDLGDRISAITGIDQRALFGELSTVSIGRRMSWASKRETTRAEDMAYCLLGIFGVNMPLMYGEGLNAFVRLQEEILKESDDHSIFAWDASIGNLELHYQITGVFATSPSDFERSGNIEAYPTKTQPTVVTNRGIQIELPIWKYPSRDEKEKDIYVAVLSCSPELDIDTSIGIKLRALDPHENPAVSFSRVRSSLVNLPLRSVENLPLRRIVLSKRDRAHRDEACRVVGAPHPGWEPVAAMPSPGFDLRTMRLRIDLWDSARDLHAAAVAYRGPGGRHRALLFCVDASSWAGFGGVVDMGDGDLEAELEALMSAQKDHCFRRRDGDMQSYYGGLPNRVEGVRVKVGLEDIRGKRISLVRFVSTNKEYGAGQRRGETMDLEGGNGMRQRLKRFSFRMANGT